MLQPLIVRPSSSQRFEIVAGERRWRAARLAGLATVPCLVRDLDDRQARLTNATENLQREDLNPVEEVEAVLEVLGLELDRPREAVLSLLHRLRNEARGRVAHIGTGHLDPPRVEAIFQGLNRTWPSFVANNLRVLRLPEDVLEAVREGGLEYTKALLVARVANQTARQTLLAEVLEHGLTKRQIAARIAALKPEARSVELRQLELDLARHFDSRVRLTGAERGELRVGFASREDLNRILELIGHFP